MKQSDGGTAGGEKGARAGFETRECVRACWAVTSPGLCVNKETRPRYQFGQRLLIALSGDPERLRSGNQMVLSKMGQAQVRYVHQFT
jgi:hypothetical protein